MSDDNIFGSDPFDPPGYEPSEKLPELAAADEAIRKEQVVQVVKEQIIEFLRGVRRSYHPENLTGEQKILLRIRDAMVAERIPKDLISRALGGMTITIGEDFSEDESFINQVAGFLGHAAGDIYRFIQSEFSEEDGYDPREMFVQICHRRLCISIHLRHILRQN